MSVGAQKVPQAGLESWEQVATTIVMCQPLRRRFAHRFRGGRIPAHLLGESPEREVHLGGRVVWKPAQYYLSLVIVGEVAQEHAGESICRQACGEDRRDGEKHAWWESEQQALDHAQTLR